jgi:MFS family permease
MKMHKDDDINSLKVHINKKMKIGKIDSLLLFFSSSLSLFFAIGYAFINIKWLLFFFPLLILGWIMPVYVGYIRGAILHDCLEERLRGWLYMFIGMTSYILLPLIFSIIGFIMPYLYMLNSILRLLVIILLPSLFYIPSLVLLIRGFPTVKLLKMFEIRSIGRDVYNAIERTILGAYSLGFVFGTLIILIEWPEQFTFSSLEYLQSCITLLGFFGVLILLVVNFVFSEKEARKLLKNYYDHT